MTVLGDYDETDMTVEEFDARMAAATDVRLSAVLVEFHGEPGDPDYPHKPRKPKYVKVMDGYNVTTPSNRTFMVRKTYEPLDGLKGPWWTLIESDKNFTVPLRSQEYPDYFVSLADAKARVDEHEAAVQLSAVLVEFHGDKGSPGYETLHPPTGKIPLNDPELLRAVDKWKGDPHPLHITAPDILNGAPPPEFPRKGFRKEMATILQAMYDHATPQPELFRGIFKRDKSLDAFEKEFAVGKTFSLGPRGFTSQYSTAVGFARTEFGGQGKASVLFVLEGGAKALPIEKLAFTNPTVDSHDVSEAERITAGLFEVVSSTLQASRYGPEYLQVIIRQREFINPPTGGFK